jgi:hypothetical protein
MVELPLIHVFVYSILDEGGFEVHLLVNQLHKKCKLPSSEIVSGARDDKSITSEAFVLALDSDF